MKITYSLLTALLLITLSQAHAQVNRDMQIMHMIKDFYTAYSSLNYKSTDKSKLDSLINKYLTAEEGKKVKAGFKTGYDILTNDQGINTKSLETLFIQTISDAKALDIKTGKEEIIKGVKGGYEISYEVNPVDSKPNQITTGTSVTVDLLVVKLNGVFKISYISNGATNNLRLKNAVKK